MSNTAPEKTAPRNDVRWLLLRLKLAWSSLALSKRVTSRASITMSGPEGAVLLTGKTAPLELSRTVHHRFGLSGLTETLAAVIGCPYLAKMMPTSDGLARCNADRNVA